MDLKKDMAIMKKQQERCHLLVLPIELSGKVNFNSIVSDDIVQTKK